MSEGSTGAGGQANRTSRIYGPSPKFLKWGGGLTAAGMLLCCAVGSRLALFGGPGLAADDVNACLVGLLFLAAGLWMVAGSVRGRPSLVIDEQGVRKNSLFGHVRRDWTELGRFILTVSHVVKGNQYYVLQAPILNPKGTRERDAYFRLGNNYCAPLEQLQQDIARRHDPGMIGAARTSVRPSPTRPCGVPGFRWPWMTGGLMAVFVVVFLMEQRMAVLPGSALSPSAATLLALGGLNAGMVRAGEIYRLLTAPLLHAGPAHILLNGIAFVLAGYMLERLVGRAWFFCLFAAGALAGSAFSLVLASPQTVSTGASGAVMAMLTALFLIGFRLPAGRVKLQIQSQSIRVALPALIPLGRTGGVAIDYGAHIGGALFGVALGWFLLRNWRDDAVLPRFVGVATVAACVLAASFVGAGAMVVRNYPTYARIGTLIPKAEYPQGAAQMAQRSDHLVAAYPRDPRSFLIAGLARVDAHDPAAAETLFRTGLSLTKDTEDLLGPALPNTFRVLLAALSVDRGDRSAAAVIAGPVCGATGSALPPPQLMALLAKTRLCPDRNAF